MKVHATTKQQNLILCECRKDWKLTYRQHWDNGHPVKCLREMSIFLGSHLIVSNWASVFHFSIIFYSLLLALCRSILTNPLIALHFVFLIKSLPIFDKTFWLVLISGYITFCMAYFITLLPRTNFFLKRNYIYLVFS